MAPHHKAYIVGAGQPTLDDVLKVVFGQEITLDQVASHRIKKESPAPKSFHKEDPPTNGEHEPARCLDHAQTRAALFFKLVALINGKSKVRLDVLHALEAILNARVEPLLPIADVDSVPLSSLADFLHGIGTAAVKTDVVTALDALHSAASLEPPGLSADERAVLQDGQVVSAGTGAICVQSGRALVDAATALAALSAEALQADVKHFDADVVEALPHKGAVETADTLRAMLEGSTLVNAKKVGAGSLPALTNVPVVHGAAIHDIAAAAAPVKAVLAAIAMPPAKDHSLQHVFSPALPTAMAALASSLLRCASLSLQRTAAVVERLHGVVSNNDGAPAPATTTALQAGLKGVINASIITFDSVQEEVARVILANAAGIGTDNVPPSLAAAEAAYASLRALQQALESEALAAVVSLRAQEGIPQTGSTSAAAGGDQGEKVDAEEKEKETGEASNGHAHREGDKKEKSKRREKKERKGGEGKGGKGGGGGGVVLGRGTFLLRKALESTAAAAVAAATVAPTPTTATATDADADAVATQLLNLSLSADSHAAAEQLRSASVAIATQLDPARPALPQLMTALTSVLEANAAQRKPKIAKGARDFAPDQMAIRELAFNKIVSVFKRHGAVAIDTPVFELRETLTGKYGEDSKLIYDLADQGGELLSLRYDLTVPFARYVALNGIMNIKRYHIAKVYRRDQPQMNRGRFREFFQCDFDIAGSYSAMVPDAEVLKVLVEILGDLELGEYEIKLNHRRLLDAMLDIAGVPPQKFRPICSAIDKLDKEPWEAVREEMTEEKGLPGHVADKIGEFVVLRGKPRELLAVLRDAHHPLAQHSDSAAALEELGILFDFLDDMNALDTIVFDLSLARGLDYYTGVIYEAVLKGGNMGSIAAGGRYDKLVGMFSGKEVPAVGVSIGIERVFAIMEAQMRAAAAAANGTIRETETQVLVASIGNGMQRKRMALTSKLWEAGIKAEFGFKPNPKMGDQLGYALKQGIPFMALFGDDELARGVVKLKDLDANTEEEVGEEELARVLTERAVAKGDRRIVFNTTTTTSSA